jgi:hypothetical protein
MLTQSGQSEANIFIAQAGRNPVIALSSNPQALSHRHFLEI